MEYGRELVMAVQFYFGNTWVGDQSLKDIFRRLYGISNQKRLFVADMGYWDGQMWRWVFRWRRNFMQWELELFEQLTSCLPQNPIVGGEEDSVLWKYDSSGSYSVKSFML